MKTNPDGWPVYEDTGEEVVDGDVYFAVIPAPSPREATLFAMTANEWMLSEMSKGAIRYFRHPENAAAAWLELVRQESQ